ncbi:hypothetical protein ACH5RR_018325 [Cinchona calisaya]|uniref:Uncharacterized protein n=1 Tax=Cinchona calisaya TaxID=153742 RepID=A0ABD2ZL40_9GENT
MDYYEDELTRCGWVRFGTEIQPEVFPCHYSVPAPYAGRVLDDYRWECIFLPKQAHCSHVTAGRAYLICFPVRLISVDAARVISDAIHRGCERCTPSLVSPCLISELCHRSGMQYDNRKEVVVAPQPPFNGRQLRTMEREHRKHHGPDKPVLRRHEEVSTSQLPEKPIPST